jgi:HEXXH motif-containing protein
MSDLVGRVTAALRNPGDSLWLPALTAGLADRGWEDLYHDTGLTPSEYGTERVLACDHNAPCQIVSVIPTALSYRDSAQAFQIELLGSDIARRYEEAGVKFYSEGEIDRERMTERVVEAVAIIKSIPTLFTTVAELVRSVHLLDAGNDDYDISFSKPQLPFSIFISVPRSDSLISAVRVAESIVHEAMHLQLTLIEHVVPLVQYTGLKYYSPWKGMNRSPRGVLHALYVFRVIDLFLGELMLSPFVVDGVGLHLQDRRAQISNEIEQVKYLGNCSDITPDGTNFVRSLLNI